MPDGVEGTCDYGRSPDRAASAVPCAPCPPGVTGCYRGQQSRPAGPLHGLERQGGNHVTLDRADRRLRRRRLRRRRPDERIRGTQDDAPPLIAGRVVVAEGDAQIWRVEEDKLPDSGTTPPSTTSSASAPGCTRERRAQRGCASARTPSGSRRTAAAASASSTTRARPVQPRVRHAQRPPRAARARGNHARDGFRPAQLDLDRPGPLSHRRDRAGARCG